MALFERAMVDAFDAPDAAPLNLQALAAFTPEDSPRLVFAFHPSVILLALSAGTFAAYEKLDSEAGGSPPEPAQASEAVAVWRCKEETAFRELEPDEFVALSEAKSGRPFGEICQMAAFQQSGELAPERLAQFLASWFEDGMIVGVSTQD